MVVADIPGLIEGAAEGRGLGHQFLRHIERARVLVVLHRPGAEFARRGPGDQLEVLLRELGDYRPELLERPRIVVGSRADLADPGPMRAAFAAPVVSPSPARGCPSCCAACGVEVEAARGAEPEPEGFVTLRPVPEGIRIDRRDDGSFEVQGREAARAVALSDLTNPEALEDARQRLAQLGVDRALARAGARNGDVVHIGEFSFDYESDDDRLDVQPFDAAPVADRGAD